MAFIAFEHKDNVKHGLKKSVMAAGSGGDMIHCEIVLVEYGNMKVSSWYPNGVEFRQHRGYENPELWVRYDLGSIDLYLLEFFKGKEGMKYTLSGLFFNMVLDGGFKSKRTFCSQICYEALQSVPHINLREVRSSSISPHDLEEIIIEYNFPRINLGQ